ncbi:MAG TPA: hypothetical protein H9713_00960 [Candidatus Mediterraneibacter surreyensis]|nr:hypothetical protein [Candidatus Mediterraneibacter surreyensis]
MLRVNAVVQEMLVKPRTLHYNGYRRTSGPAFQEQQGRILQEEDVEE